MNTYAHTNVWKKRKTTSDVTTYKIDGLMLLDKCTWL